MPRIDDVLEEIIAIVQEQERENTNLRKENEELKKPPVAWIPSPSQEQFRAVIQQVIELSRENAERKEKNEELRGQIVLLFTQRDAAIKENGRLVDELAALWEQL